MKILVFDVLIPLVFILFSAFFIGESIECFKNKQYHAFGFYISLTVFNIIYLINFLYSF